MTTSRFANDPFAALLAEANRVGWPEHYRTDLDRDREILEKLQPKQFGWVLRKCGSYTLPAQDDAISDHWTNGWATTCREWSLQLLPCIWRLDRTVKLYWWDGDRLRPQSYEALMNKLLTFGREEVETAQRRELCR